MSSEDPHDDYMEMGDVERLISRRKYKEALSLLLKLKQRRFQRYWANPIHVAGTIQALCFADIAGDSEDEIIVGTKKGEITAINIEGGDDKYPLWVRSIAGDIKRIQATANPRDYDLIFVCCGDEHLIMLDKRGEIRKNLFLPDERISCCIISEQSQQEGGIRGEIIIGSEKNKIYIYGADLQQQLAPAIVTPSGVNVLCALKSSSPDRKLLIAGSVDGSIFTFDVHDREHILPDWHYKVAGRVQSICTKDIDEDNFNEIIVGSEDGYVYVLSENGKLKWRYYAGEAVLDVNVLDIDGDGHCEILLGTANGHMDVLSYEGELRWRFKVGGQVHIVRAKDMNLDGRVEVAIGSDNQLMLWQVVGLAELDKKIGECFDKFKREMENFERNPLPVATIVELTRDEDEYIRAFALTRLAGQASHSEEDFQILWKAFEDTSPVVKLEMVNVIITLFNNAQAKDVESIRQRVQIFLAQLATSNDQEPLFALVNQLRTLKDIDKELCFKYLHHFLHNEDIWVRHAVIHQLTALLESHPAQVWSLLLEAMGDGDEWIRQEAAYALARYLDLYSNQLESRIDDLLNYNVQPSIIETIANVAKKPLIRDPFILLALLLSTSFEEVRPSLLAYIKRTDALSSDSDDSGRTQLQVYQELSRLLHAPTIEQLEVYHYDSTQDQRKGSPRFMRIAYILKRLIEVINNLQAYRTRGEEQALFKAVSVIEEMSRTIQSSLSYSENETPATEDVIFAVLLKRWREEMQTKLHLPEGAVRLKLEIHEITRQKDDLITFSIRIRNEGSRVARKVRVILQESSEGNFKLVNNNEYVLEEIASLAVAQSVQFAIQLLPEAIVELVNLLFILIFNDFEEGQPLFDGFKKGQEQRNEIPKKVKVDGQLITHIFTEIPTPYQSGVPIKRGHNEMFFGRGRELHELQEKILQTDKIIILSGLRRAGKTSLLHRLEQIVSEANVYVPIYVDLIVCDIEGSQDKFFTNIALSIQEQLQEKRYDLPQPKLEDFQQDPLSTLQKFMESVVSILPAHRLLLIIDEFVVIERFIDDGILDRDFLQTFFAQMKQSMDIKFLLAVNVMRHRPAASYWADFIGNANTFYYPLPSKIEPEDAQQLISNPIKPFLHFDESAIRLIQRLTNNQPYFIHVLCEEIIRLCNKHHKEFVDSDDVNTAKENILKRGATYLEWIRGPLNQMERLLLSALAEECNNNQPILFSSNIRKRFDDLNIPYDEERLLQARDNLIEDGIIEAHSDSLYLTILVELLLEWLRTKKLFKP